LAPVMVPTRRSPVVYLAGVFVLARGRASQEFRLSFVGSNLEGIRIVRSGQVI
jgi:hypothetical protein